MIRKIRIFRGLAFKIQQLALPFHPDGKRLIFQAEREPDNPFYQIYILSLETGDVNRVSPGTGKTTCSFFDPKADRVIFASTHLDPDAVAKQKQEIELRAAGKERRYAWDYDETYEIFSAKPDGSDMVRLTDAIGYDAEGSFSPDGQWIIYQRPYGVLTMVHPDDRQRALARGHALEPLGSLAQLERREECDVADRLQR